MNRTRCSQCSLINFASSEVCKRCGEPLTPVYDIEGGTEPDASQDSYSLQTPSSSGAHGYAYQYGMSPASGKGKSVGLVMLALICLVALIGIPLYLKNRGTNEFAGLAWKEYKPDDGSFSILMPGVPMKNSMGMTTPVGMVQVNMYFMETEGKTAFGVGSMEFPSASATLPIDQVFDKTIESMTKRTEATILSRKNITLGGHPGIELEIKPPAKANKDGDKGLMRVYWAAPKIYIVMVGGPDSAEAAAARAKYLDSFKLNK
jgi:hypothetical protein